MESDMYWLEFILLAGLSLIALAKALG